MGLNRRYTLTYAVGMAFSLIGFAVRLWARARTNREREKPMPPGIGRISSLLALTSYILASALVIPAYAALTGLMSGAVLWVAYKLGRLPPPSEWPDGEPSNEM